MGEYFVACVGVVIEDDKVLLVREGKNVAEGTWALPGGSLEENEKLEECVDREIEEETGLDAEARNLIGTYVMEGDAVNEEVFVFAFECVSEDTELTKREEDSVQEADFFKIQELEKLNLRFPQLKEIVKDSTKANSSHLKYI